MTLSSSNRPVSLLAVFYRFSVFCLCQFCVPMILSGENAEGTKNVSGGSSEHWAMAEKTLVLYNANVPESGELAIYYASRRGIPKAQVIGLSCSTEETISRAVYNQQIREPLQGLFKNRGWWSEGFDANGTRLQSSRDIRVLCPVYGIPLRVEGLEGELLTLGTEVSVASVDSELAVIAIDQPRLAGPMPNPYFRQKMPFPALGESRMLLVSRLDGPSPKVVRLMIDGALEAEKNGLWGKAYIDYMAEDRSGWKIGDRWLEGAARSLWDLGIPVVEEKQNSRFPYAYPMGDAIFYLGWYAGEAEGPFAVPEFRMRPGAVACHIHSFSAETIRDSRKRWAGPLVAHGAAVALGNVYEPFLQLTAHLDIFVDRLLQGFSVAEATWMATPVLSWMNTTLGDPLYRPFGKSRSGGRTTSPENSRDLSYRRVAELCKAGAGEGVGVEDVWKDRISAAARSAEASGDGVTLEALGLCLLDRGDHGGAVALFKTAAAVFQTNPDRVRTFLHAIDILRREGQLDRVEEELRNLIAIIGETAEGRVVEALLQQVDPPLPDFPTPSREIPLRYRKDSAVP